MAAAAVGVGIDIIGVVSGVFGIVQFFQSVFPPSPSSINQAGASTVRIAAGMDGKGLSQAEGPIDEIDLFNDYEGWIGHATYYPKDSQIKSGSFTDFTVDCQGQQPTYVQIRGREDAVCIAYITQTWPDGTQRGWSGDVGMQCDQSYWAYSNVIISDDGHKPACTWLDVDHTGGIKQAAMQIHMQDFTSTIVDTSNTTKYCSAPVMVFEDHTDNLPSSIWKRSTTNAKRGTGILKRSAAMSNHIIGSQDASHSALKLCQSPTSYSPDFVSFSEGIFCDMDTKTPWPLCSTEKVKDDCYHWETHTLITSGDHKPRNYGNVVEWE